LPDDRKIIDTRVANALILDAGLPPAAAAGLELAGLGKFNSVISAYGRAAGGLWVGGRVILTTGDLSFHPNAANRVMNRGTLDIMIPLAMVASVEVLPAFFTKIVAIRAGGSLIRLRCYGAPAFPDLLRRAVANRDTWSGGPD
jgi:hypothetical protein